MAIYVYICLGTKVGMPMMVGMVDGEGSIYLDPLMDKLQVGTFTSIRKEACQSLFHFQFQFFSFANNFNIPYPLSAGDRGELGHAGPVVPASGETR